MIQLEIKNEPKTGFKRVIGITNFEINQKAKYIKIEAEMLYFNDKNEPLPQFTHPIKWDGKNWVIENNYDIPKLGLDFKPLPNPDYDKEDENSLPYLTIPAFDGYSGIISGMLTPLLAMGVMKDDANNLFDL